LIGLEVGSWQREEEIDGRARVEEGKKRREKEASRQDFANWHPSFDTSAPHNFNAKPRGRTESRWMAKKYVSPICGFAEETFYRTWRLLNLIAMWL
jgi:hypothetical protein